MTLSNLGEAYAMVTQTGSGVLTKMLKSEDAFSKIGGRSQGGQGSKR